MNQINIAFTFLFNLLISLFNFLNTISFTYEGITIYYGWLLVGILIIYFAISVFWKGARA